MKTINSYGIFGFAIIFINIMKTKLFYSNSRLIRFPIHVRGKKRIIFGRRFTAGIHNRIEVLSRNGNIIIGENVQINDFNHIAAIESIVIGKNTLIASKVFITDHNHGTYSGPFQSDPDTIPADRPLTSAPVIIGCNVWIGENVVILPGCIIGDGSIIGAGSVVNGIIPKNSIAVGSPAIVKKTYDRTERSWLK
jgi:lipopolysaccharide O-acetyltransferase